MRMERRRKEGKGKNCCNFGMICVIDDDDQDDDDDLDG